MSILQRRGFLKQLAASGAALTGVARSGGMVWANEQAKESIVKTQADLPIVDTHQHLWDLTKLTLPWTKGNEKLGRSFVMSDYLAATRGLNVVKTVYMEVDVEPAQQQKEAEFVIGVCQRDDNPMVAAVISGRPASGEFKKYAEQFKGSLYIKGIRQVLHGESTPAGYCLDPQFVKSIQLLGDLGLSFDLCMRSGELADGDKLVGQCPRTRFIVDHCGNMSVQDTDRKARAAWMDGMRALAQRDNVVCKVSGIVASAKEDWQTKDLEPNIRFTLETFGKDRTMFGGDWPVCTLAATYRQWVEALRSIVRERPLAEQRQLFHDNAVKFYGLKDKKWTAPTS